MTERFQLLEQIGKGGMGVVWKARDTQTGELVAVKMLHDVYAQEPEYVERFEREVELAKRVVSRNVVQVIGYGKRDGAPYMVMEYVEGPSLRQVLRERGPLSVEEAFGIARQVLDGLSAAHAANILHRDIKPSNILITPTGTAKLADFGIARADDLTRLTLTPAFLGAPAYVAPEGPKDIRSELYSVGCALYEMLTGAPPFEGTSLHDTISKHIREPVDWTRVPAEARPILAPLLAKDPLHRPQSVGIILESLRTKGNWPEPHSESPVIQEADEPVWFMTFDRTGHPWARAARTVLFVVCLVAPYASFVPFVLLKVTGVLPAPTMYPVVGSVGRQPLAPRHPND